jgi:hypothetical protein
MKRFTLILAAVLAVQLALALVLTFTGSDYAAMKAEQPLLAFNKDKVDQIAIDSSEGKSVTLKKQGDKWLVSTLADFPANDGLVKNLLGTLTSLK